MLLNPKPKDAVNALIVIFPEKQPVMAKQQSFDYRVMNRTNKAIFVVVESLNVMGWDRLEGPFGLIMGGGVSRGKGSTHELLRLLYASTVSPNGNPMSGEEEMQSETSCKVRVVSGAEDLTRYIGARGTLRLSIKYYVESAKAPQRQTITVPISIEQAEPPGAAQPATQPADKTHAEDQPSTPTSKDAPR